MSEDSGERPARPTVVIVDDAEEVRALVDAQLRMSGRFEVVAEASDGAQAVAAARDHRPDLMLLDVSMPVMDGLEALPKVLDASPGTRVAMYSGFQQEELAEQTRELGASAFLQKSIALDLLVEELLRIASADREPPAHPELRDQVDRSVSVDGVRPAGDDWFRLLVQRVTDYAIFMLDPHGAVVSWNAGAERIQGYRAAEIIGRHFRTFYPQEQQEARHPEWELTMALRNGRYEEEGWRIRKDGTRFWANVVITAVRDEHGELIGFAKVTRDTSERRALLQERERAAAALADANARLKQAAEDQARFLAVTAHELRTPVGVLAGTADTLAAHWQQLDAEERRDLLDGMRTGAARLRRLLSDLLTASRLQASALELELGRADVGAVVEAAAEAARRAHPDVEITADCEPGLVVRGDRERLAQAIDNLVQNALSHGVPPVVLSARAVGAEVEVVVTDAGPGVPPAMRRRLFDRFATGRTRGGTGLGLYIVRELVRSHGGEASYQVPPDADDGGAFVLHLPLAGIEADPGAGPGA